jgi:hypothetical protein
LIGRFAEAGRQAEAGRLFLNWKKKSQKCGLYPGTRYGTKVTSKRCLGWNEQRRLTWLYSTAPGKKIMLYDFLKSSDSSCYKAILYI